MNCILYARVSTDKQADLSIPAQLEAMRAYAHQHHWLVAEEFVEPGASAKTADRPALKRLLARAGDSKLSTDVVLVHKIDRLARNVYDHATIKALLTQRKIQLASVVENVDDSVPGQLVENIMASIAQFYSANLSEEVKKGMRQKILNGGWPHLPPCGYVSVRNSNGRGSHVEIHPRKGLLIAKAFELYASGHYKVRALARRLASDGIITKSGLPLPASQLTRLLSNPFYIARIVSKGMEVPGAHQPLIATQVFDRVQKLLQRPHHSVGVKGTVKGFVLRGVAICAACRGRMTAEQHGKWGYYRCSRQSYKKERCVARFTRASIAHADLQRVCGQVQLRRGTTEAIRDAAGLLISNRSLTRERRLAELQTEHAGLGQTETQLTEAFAHGDLLPDAYRERAVELRSRRIELENAANRPVASDEELLGRVKKTLDLVTSLWDLYQSLDDERRAELLRTVFRTVVLGPEGILGFSLNPPFQQLQNVGEGAEANAAASLLETVEAV